MQSKTEDFNFLLVEDDEVDIQSVQRELKKLDIPINLLIARDGIEALDILHGKNGKGKSAVIPHLILLDINMPRMNGIEFLKKIRADEKFKFITVFILTTAYTSHDKVATQDLKVSGYIVKPMSFNDVMQLYWSVVGSPN